MNAMILAAGKGTRLRPLTDLVPKPMVQIGGLPILEHNVRLLVHHGISDIIINLHHIGDVVTTYFGDGRRWGASISYSHEAELLGTAGAVKKCADQFTSTFLVLYGDNLIECDLSRLLRYHRSKQSTLTMALHYRDDPTASGMAGLDDDGRIVEFLEKPGPERVFSHWVNAGVLVAEPRVLDAVPTGSPSDFGKDVLPALLRARAPVLGYCMSAPEGLVWIDTPDDLVKAEAAWHQRQHQ